MRGKPREMTPATNDTFTRTADIPLSAEKGTTPILGASTETERYAIHKAMDKTAKIGNTKIQCFTKNLGTK